MNNCRRRVGRCAGIALALGAAGCQGAPRDAYQAGHAALMTGELATALYGFDCVSVSDLRYPEARLTAAALEGRLRRHKEQLLLGLTLRGEWRDDEAIAAFRGALDAWPGHEETRQLIAATAERKRLLSQLQDRGASRVTSRVATAGAVVPPLPADRGPIDRGPVVEAPGAAPPPAAEPPRERRAASAESIGAELAQIEAHLATGELDQVLADLFALHGRVPDDARVGQWLARLLQQRGLLRYGQGQVPAAIVDWQRAVALDPSLPTAKVLLDLATTELARPPR